MKLIDPLTNESEIRVAFKKSLLNRRKSIVKIEQNYLPCYVFNLVYKSKKETKTLHVICDAVRAKVRRMSWPQPVHSSRGEFPDHALSQERALKAVKDEFRWGGWTSPFRIKKKYHLEEVNPLEKIGYPFWVVYFKRRGRYNFIVYDALSGKREDFFGKDIFLELFGLTNDSFSRASIDKPPAIDTGQK